MPDLTLTLTKAPEEEAVRLEFFTKALRFISEKVLLEPHQDSDIIELDPEVVGGVASHLAVCEIVALRIEVEALKKGSHP